MAGLRTLSTGLAIVLATTPAGAQDVDCSDISVLPQQQINLCLALRFETADHQMQAAYAAAMTRVNRVDGVSLSAAQEAWITYRAMMCTAEAGFMRGGSGEQMLRFGCMVRITEARVAELAGMPLSP